MNDAMHAGREGRAVDPAACGLVLASVGGSFLGAVNQGELYVRLAPHEERIFGWGRLLGSFVRLDPLSAFREQLLAGAR